MGENISMNIVNMNNKQRNCKEQSDENITHEETKKNYISQPGHGLNYYHNYFTYCFGIKLNNEITHSIRITLFKQNEFFVPERKEIVQYNKTW